MGWSWAVTLCTEYAADLLDAAGVGGTSLNVPIDSFLRSDSFYRGAYIDNLFCLAELELDARDFCEKVIKECGKRGLPLSEISYPELARVLLGLRVGDEPVRDIERAAVIGAPWMFGAKLTAISKRQSCKFSLFESMLGTGAWLFPISRRYFSLFFEVYRLLKRKRRANTKKGAIIRLSKKVRDEFAVAGALAPGLEHSLDFKPATEIVASDSSLEGWAIVSKASGSGFFRDTGLEEPEPRAAAFLTGDGWRVRKSRAFRTRPLDFILPGEITGARQAVITHSRREPGTDFILYTDNSNIYFSVKKGRSSTFRLNSLCRCILLAELVYGTRVHVRWCKSELMPADIHTRELLVGRKRKTVAKL